MLRLARVRPTVSVPCFGDVVCSGAPCCVVLCFAVLRRAGLCCVAVPSALSCPAVPCRAVVCLVAAWLAAPCCAVPRRVVSCCAVSCRRVPCRGALHGGALLCGLPDVSCYAMFRCAVVCGGPFSLPFRCGVMSALVGLALFLVPDAGRGYVAGWWLVGAVRCCVACWIRVAGVWMGCSSRWVRWLSAGVALPAGLCLGSVSSGLPCP